jgi:hypothetical protein
MPVNSADQQITTPVLGDAADQAVAFGDYNVDVEPRLVKKYADAADRTARNAAPTNGEVSFLTNPGRHDVWMAPVVSAWWEMRPLFAYKTAEAQLANANTTLFNDTHLFLPMQTNAWYALDGMLVWESGTTGDIKFGWTVPAGAFMQRWSLIGIDTTATTLIGVTNVGISSSAGTTLARGGVAVGTMEVGHLQGLVQTAGTAGNLQLQWAQNASEAVNTRLKQYSWIRLMRVA